MPGWKKTLFSWNSKGRSKDMGGLSHMINKLAITKQIPIFSKLNWFDLQVIASKCYFEEYKKGEVIYEEGSPADAFYCLVSGRLQAFAACPDGEKRNIEYIHRGMHFGGVAILTGENHNLTFRAINDS